MSNYIDTLKETIIGDVYYHHEVLNNVDIHTVGCELSEWDGEQLANGILEPAILLNTCAVTEYSQIASEYLARILSKLYPEKKLYITGCGVNYNKEYYSKLGIALDNSEKFEVCKPKAEIKANTKLIKIQDGCKNRCAFCVVSMLRNAPSCLPKEQIFAEVERILRTNQTEIGLVGTEITRFHTKEYQNVIELCKDLIQHFPKITKISLGALDPAPKIVDKIIQFVKSNPKMDNLITLSTQSACDATLKRMNRRHNVKRLYELKALGEDKIDFLWDIITGFPGETDAEFNETLENLKRLKPISLHSFTFSIRKGTLAENLPNKIPLSVAKNRQKILLSTVNSYNYLNMTHKLPDSEQFKRRMEHFPVFDYKIYALDDYAALRALYESNTSNTIGFEYKINNLSYVYTLDIINKLLTTQKNNKIILEIHLTNALINDVLTNNFNIIEKVLNLNGFFRFLPSEEELDISNFKKFITTLVKGNIYPIETLYNDFKNTKYAEIIELYIQMLFG